MDIEQIPTLKYHYPFKCPQAYIFIQVGAFVNTIQKDMEVDMEYTPLSITTPPLRDTRSIKHECLYICQHSFGEE